MDINQDKQENDTEDAEMGDAQQELNLTSILEKVTISQVINTECRSLRIEKIEVEEADEEEKSAEPTITIKEAVIDLKAVEMKV